MSDESAELDEELVAEELVPNKVEKEAYIKAIPGLIRCE